MHADIWAQALIPHSSLTLKVQSLSQPASISCGAFLSNIYNFSVLSDVACMRRIYNTMQYDFNNKLTNAQTAVLTIYLGLYKVRRTW